MKILILNDFREKGGAELVAYNTFLALQAVDNLEVSFTSIENVDKNYFERSNSVNALFYIFNPVVYGNFKKLLLNKKPNVIHLHNFYHAFSPSVLSAIKAYKKRYKTKVIMTAHDCHLLCPNSSFARYSSDGDFERCTKCIDRRFYRVLFYNCDRRGFIYSALKGIRHTFCYNLLGLHSVVDIFISPSRFLKEKLLSAYPGLTVEIINNPVFELEKNFDAITKKAEDCPHFELVFIGRLSKEKGLEEFIKNDFAGLKPRSFGIIGEGDQKDRLVKLTDEMRLADKIKFLGAKSHIESLAILYNAQKLVLPSTVYENQPLVLLEALALGKEIIVNPVGGIKEISENQSFFKNAWREKLYTEKLLQLYYN
jgi:glycosyltransferase involved in cell wall biosynthesis